MTDLDQQIRSTLEGVVSAAPPPVPADAILRRQVADGVGSSRFSGWVVALSAAAASVALIWLALANLVPPADTAPGSTVAVETTDSAPVNTGPVNTGSADGRDPADTEQPVELRFTVAGGRWLSEIVPDLARQLPGITADELWAALESAEPHPWFSPTDPGLGSVELPGLPDARRQWEGLLLPSTYVVEADGEPVGAADVVEAMHDELVRLTTELGYGEAQDSLGLSPYQVLVVASLVEAEAPNDADRPKVARVIYNRLAEGLPIGLDVAYLYGAQDRKLEFTREILETPGPYGLRTAHGLPPTPIAAPNRASLEAAIDPATGPWLFYAPGDEQGGLRFSSTPEEHQADIAAAHERGLFD